MSQAQAGIQCKLNVAPKIDHWIELENASAFDCMQIVVVQKIEDDVFAKSGTDKARQANNQMIGKMAFNKFFQESSVQPISMQSGLIHRRFFIHSNGVLEDIHRADQDERLALDGFQMADQPFDFFAICLGFAVGDPLLSRGSSTNYGVKRSAFNLAYVG